MIRHYLRHLKSLYQRPTLNGIDGNMELRSASPFELFLDLIFVIALSKLAYLFEVNTFISFFEATLLFVILYSLWHTVTTYTVMFMKTETNYFTRAMIFLIMLPLIFFLSIQNISSQNEIMIFCFSLATSKIFLSLIFKDSIVNASLNNITTSNLYLLISKNQLISAIILMVAAFIHVKVIFILLLIIVALREAILVPYIQRKAIEKSFAPLLINKQLFLERQLLFIIVIFGESLVSIINSISNHFTIISVFHIIIAFTILFLFYVRIYEETEHNSALSDSSTNLVMWMTFDYMIFILFLLISMLPELFESHKHIPIAHLSILISILNGIITSHYALNKTNLETITNPIDALYYKIDNKMLALMFIVVIILSVFHNSITIIYMLLLLFFSLHVIALPFRRHLISNKCELAIALRAKDKDTCTNTIRN